MKDMGTTNKVKKRKLRITQEVVIGVKERIEAVGLERATSEFDCMTLIMGTTPGWAETAQAVYTVFAEQRRMEEEKKQELALEVAQLQATRHITMQNTQSLVFTGNIQESTFNQGGHNDGAGIRPETGVA